MAKITEITPRGTEKSKVRRISQEVKRLKAIYKDLPEEKLVLATRLIERAAFQMVTLEDLEEEVNRSGFLEAYQNGDKQTGIKQSAALQAYNSLYKNYQATLKELSTQLPERRAVSRLDEFIKANG